MVNLDQYTNYIYNDKANNLKCIIKNLNSQIMAEVNILKKLQHVINKKH